MKPFNVLIQESAAAHGHLCPGQVVGVRMAMLGCRLLGFDNPAGHDQIKKLIVYIEMDRCTADAVSLVTGVKLGRRSLKFMDYGIMAATFINLETEMAYRILSTEESRDLSQLYAPEIGEKFQQQLEAYQRMPDSVLFRIQQVEVQLSDFDMPGPTRSKSVCMQCGQVIRDHREVTIEEKTLCKPCSGVSYFKNAREIIWPDMNQCPADQKMNDCQPQMIHRNKLVAIK